MTTKPAREVTGAARYGRYCWRVETDFPQENTATFLMADEVRVDATGALVCTGHSGDDPLLLAVFGPGQWRACFAASLFGGSPIAIDE